MLRIVKRLSSKLLCKKKDRILDSVAEKVPSRRVFYGSTTEGETMDEVTVDEVIADDACRIARPCHPQAWSQGGRCRPPALSVESVGSDYGIRRDRDVLDRDALGANASVSYEAVRSSGPPARPLEFPAPTVDRAVTVAADIIDHRTGHIFHATSVLMRRPVHSKNCASRCCAPPVTSGGSASFDSAYGSLAGAGGGQHYRTKSPDMIHSWQPAFNAPSNSLAAAAATKRQQHRRVQSLSSNAKRPPCDSLCDLPDRAYCIRKKICNTTYGSVRLCVVLKRVSQNIRDYARTLSKEEEDRFRSLPTHHRGDRIGADVERVPEWETTDEMVAVKVVNWSRLQSLRGRHLEDPVKELAALQQLIGKTHPNITSISDALQNETHLFCVYPYIAGGDLCGALLDNMASSLTGRIDENLARTWFRQMLSAINYLQKKGICHRDLCLENMMVDKKNNISVIDFGLCLRVPFADPGNRSFVTDVSANTSRRLMKTQGQCGRLEYMAPEVSMRSEAFDGFAIDIWAAGIVLFELLVGKKPFTMPDPVDKNFQTISVEGKLDRLLQAKGIEVNQKAVDLLQGMLRCDPSKRLTLSQIVNHPWVQGRAHHIVPSVEDGGVESRWFINNKSINDRDSVKKCPDLFLTGLLNSYSTMHDIDASTSVSSDAPSQNPLSPASSSDISLCQSPRQKCSVEPQGEAEIEILNETNTQKKQNWLALCLKNMKGRRTGKPTP